uniref:Major allergen I polypeptide chain 2-like n=1 Tax=Equus caballus TaxID=9796 RepID=A0A9L0QWX5_HORSE
MKGALLVLALLVTRELGIKMAEACPSFYAVLGVLSLGSKTLLDTSLNLVNATEPEKVAMGKIQDCYNEAGVITKISDLIIMNPLSSMETDTAKDKHLDSLSPPHKEIQAGGKAADQQGHGLPPLCKQSQGQRQAGPARNNGYPAALWAPFVLKS